ncbi:hypothetical protein WJX74_003946 [Apatococcus lobatus]|uniref:Uncharacterized protein n=1 Tax=Apatococcus lobatus TaxID=904363 RepID=A0AAW1SFY1_9CHLO
MAPPASAASALEAEYDAYLTSIAQEMAALDDEARKPGEAGLGAREARARLEQAQIDFTLRAAPIFARCYQGLGSHQALFEELATLTANVEAVARIQEARARREEALAAAHRGPNERKRRRRQAQVSARDFECFRPGCDGQMMHVPREAQMVCPECGFAAPFQLDSAPGCVPYDTVRPVSESTYCKETHLAELLQNVQGKERTEVPAEVVHAVRRELRKFRQLDRPETVTPLVVRSHLRRLRMAKWYDHAMQIAIHATDGRCPRVVLPPELERDLHAAFSQIIEPFQRAIRGFDRTNMLSYSLVCFKRCELNGFEQYKKHFRLLKNPAKLTMCDRWWKSVCEELGWPFKPTV